MSPLLACGQPLVQPQASSQMGPFQGPTPDPSSVDFLARAPSGAGGVQYWPHDHAALPLCRVQVLFPHFSPQPPGSPFFPFMGLPQLTPKRALLQ